MSERVLRFRGADPCAVDPHWDYEHEPGADYDAAARRPWRSRVFSAGGAQSARVGLFKEGARVAAELGRLEDGWAPLRSSALDLGPAGALVAVDVSRLDPGSYALHLELVERPTFNRKQHFTLRRAPFYRFAGPVPSGAVPRPRSSTGLCERHGALVAAHAWTLCRHVWKNGAGYEATAVTVVAVTRFHSETVLPLETRYSLTESGLDGWTPASFRDWATPSDHPLQLDLPFPSLVGLPAQPRDDGRF